MSVADEAFMQIAIDLAKQGEGYVEPNPMVGCVLVKDDEVIGRGWHKKFGGPHAEVNAIDDAANNGHADLTGATAFVTLEPCSHTGKTGPCSEALIAANVSRVVVAVTDPNPKVAGQGIAQLRNANIQVDIGILDSASRFILAPYLKRMRTGRPWIIAKWAMTFDGKIATRTGDSKWISNEESRSIVHQIRGRVDGVMVGIGTALADDPMLNARPAGARSAARIVIDSRARLPLDSKLVKTASESPVLIAVGPEADNTKCQQLKDRGCELIECLSNDANERLDDVLRHLGNSGTTNVLVEGGGQLLGSLNDCNLIDEVHVFLGAKIAGGTDATSPVEGVGFELIKEASKLKICSSTQLGEDIYIVGRVVS